MPGASSASCRCLGAIVIFAFAIRSLGLAITGAVLVLVSSLTVPDPK